MQKTRGRPSRARPSDGRTEQHLVQDLEGSEVEPIFAVTPEKWLSNLPETKRIMTSKYILYIHKKIYIFIHIGRVTP